VVLGSAVRSSVLALEADRLVDEQVTCDRVAGSEDSEANDNTWRFVSPCNAAETINVHDEPRGINSAGILRSRRRRCETVWAMNDRLCQLYPRLGCVSSTRCDSLAGLESSRTSLFLVLLSH
jgi:hypothetical protein